jgi:hypothetical protein
MKEMEALTRAGRPAIIGGIAFGLLYSGLSLSEDGTVPALDVLENHGVFHLVLAPVYALLVLGFLQARAQIGERINRLARFASSLAIFGLSVGVIAGAIVPILEFAVGVETAEGTADAIIHMPEFMPFVVGSLLFGIAIAGSRLLPRKYGIFIAAGAILMFVFGAGGGGPIQIVGSIGFGLGLASLGLAVQTPRPHHRTSVTQAEPAV